MTNLIQDFNQIQKSLKKTFYSTKYLFNNNQALVENIRTIIDENPLNFNDLTSLRDLIYNYQDSLVENINRHQGTENLLLNTKAFIHDFQIGNTELLVSQVTSIATLQKIKDSLLDSLEENILSYTSDETGASSLTSDILFSFLSSPSYSPIADINKFRSTAASSIEGVSSVANSIIYSLEQLPSIFSATDLSEKINVFNDQDINFSSDLISSIYYNSNKVNLADFGNVIYEMNAALSSYLDSNFAKSSYVDYGLDSLSIYAENSYAKQSELSEYAKSSYVDYGLDSLSTYAETSYAKQSELSEYAKSSYVDYRINSLSTYAETNYAKQSELSEYAKSSYVDYGINSLSTYAENSYAKTSDLVGKIGTLRSFYSCASTSDVTPSLIATGSSMVEARSLAMQSCYNWAFLTAFNLDASLEIDSSKKSVYFGTSSSGPCIDAVGSLWVPSLTLINHAVVLSITTNTVIGSSYNIPIYCVNTTCQSNSFTVYTSTFGTTFTVPAIPFTCTGTTCTSSQVYYSCSSGSCTVNNSPGSSYYYIPALTASSTPATAGSLASLCIYELDH